MIVSPLSLAGGAISRERANRERGVARIREKVMTAIDKPVTIRCEEEERSEDLRNAEGFQISCSGPAYMPQPFNNIGANVVEISPPYDHAELTAMAAANLAYELLALFALAPH